MTDSPKKVKKSAPKKPAMHPKYTAMIAEAIETLKERGGSSRQAILKYIQANFTVGTGAPNHLKLALRRSVEKKTLLQVKGKGASGSFKLPAKATKAPKKPAKKVVAKKPAKKTATKKKAPSAKKATPKKKTAAKKTPKKASAKKGAKKPVAKKPASKKTKTVSKKKPAKKAGKK